MINTNTTNDTASVAKILPWIMCGLAALFYCYEYLLRIAPGVMEAELMSAYGVTAAGVGLVSSYYFFAYTPMQLFVGVIMDKFGPRRILTVAVLSCALGAACMGFTTAFELALFGRFLIGFGSAFAFVGVLKLASVWLPPDRFAFIAGLTTTLGMVGAMVGQNSLQAIVHKVGMDHTLIYACVAGFALLPIMWFIVKDYPEGHHHENNSISYKRLLNDIGQVLKNKQIWLNGLCGAMIILPTTVFAEMWGGSFFKSYYDLTPHIATRITSMVFLGWAVGGPLAGYISDSIGRRVPLLILGSLSGALIMLMLIYGPSLNVNLLYVLCFLFGVVSSVEIICFAVAKENSPDSVAGTAIAITNFIIVCVGVCQWIVGKMLDFSRQGLVDDAGLPIYGVEDFQFALIVLPISMIIGFVCCFFIKETHCQAFQED